MFTSVTRWWSGAGRPGAFCPFGAGFVSSWTDPIWLAAAYEWIHGQLACLDTRAVGEIEQTYVQPWSTVLRVPMDLGDVQGSGCPRRPGLTSRQTSPEPNMEAAGIEPASPVCCR